MRTSVLLSPVVVLLAALAGCSSPPSEYRYDVLITEPSGNAAKFDGQLLGNWSCDPAANAEEFWKDPEEMWTEVPGEMRATQLRLTATCQPGALLTVQVDAAIRQPDYNPTRLQCEVFDDQGDRVTEESVTRGGMGVSAPTCRVPIPGGA